MKVILSNVRLSFPALFQEDTFGRYSATFIIDPDSEASKACRDAVKAVAEEKWKDGAAATLAKLTAADKVCYRKEEKTNNKGEPYSGFDGMHYVTASCKARPLVLDRDKSTLTEQDGRPYGGCYVNAVIDIWTQQSPQWGKRVNATLKGVQFANDGDAFGSSAPASVNDFDELEPAAANAADMF
jgi:hypothetical protein